MFYLFLVYPKLQVDIFCTSDAARSLYTLGAMGYVNQIKLICHD